MVGGSLVIVGLISVGDGVAVTARGVSVGVLGDVGVVIDRGVQAINRNTENNNRISPNRREIEFFGET
jgi:hypothetical protein